MRRDIPVRNALVDALLLSADIHAQQDGNVTRRQCESVLAILSPLVKGSENFQILAPWVKANACLNQLESATAVKRQLEAMSYRDPAYLDYLSTHPPKKVNL